MKGRPPLGPRAYRAPSSDAAAPHGHKLWHRRRYLPHFDAGAVVQSITFRLADSLPREIYETAKRSAKSDATLYHNLEARIDEGRGACILRQPEIAMVVQNALKCFDGVRYQLIAWVVMPNHVHAVIEQAQGHSLGRVVHSWESFTAHEINKVNQTKGLIWAEDYFDRFIRDDVHLANAVGYVENNPVKAGLVKKPEQWPYSSATRRSG